MCIEVKRLLRQIVASGVSLILVALLSPGILYAVGLARLQSYPESPPADVGSDVRGSGWDANGGFGPHGRDRGTRMKLAPVNPWAYAYHNLFRCSREGGSASLHACVYYFPGYMAAYAVSSDHLDRDKIEQPRTLWSELPTISLSIWLTRHWSAEEIDSYLVIHDNTGI